MDRVRFLLGAFALVGLALPCSGPAMAQSLLVEGLWLMEQSAEDRPDRLAVLALGIELHRDLTDEVNELQDLRANIDGFLLYSDAGDPLTVSQSEAVGLAETLASDLFLSGDPYTIGMGLLRRAESGGELERAVALSVFSALQDLWERANAQLLTSDEARLEALSSALLGHLGEFDSHNRRALDELIETIHNDRALVAGVVARMRARWGDTAPRTPDVPEGIMNEPGYYVAQVSGSGWHKNGAGYATRIDGYANFIFEVTEQVSEATQTRWTWQVPPGFDILAFAHDRQAAAEAQSREACAGLPTLGPRNPAPDIWENGPHYELVQGPITDWAEARTVRGSDRVENNDPTGNRFWHHEGGYTHDDLDPVCERYGVSLVD